MSNTDKVSLAAIVDDALDNWFEKKREVPRMHDLVLYSDERALIRILKEIDRLVTSHWFRGYSGRINSQVTRLLKRKKWFHIVMNLDNELKKGIKRCNQLIINQINTQSKKRPAFWLGFLANDIIRQGSLKTLVEMEKEMHVTKGKIVGKRLCITNMNELYGGKVKDFIDVLNNHDQVFIAFNEHLYKFSLSDEHPYKLIT